MIRFGVISGKGGTGKTMVTAALADIGSLPQVLADCDVDASNLELLIPPTRRLTTEPFMGLKVARIDLDRCRDCGICADRCRFGAVLRQDDAWQISAAHCEGCGVCEYACPMGAITMEPRVCGEIYTSETERGNLAHACLYPGSGTSGLLVHEVKKRALGMADGCDLLLADGPPGIGCPLISTISGMGAVLIVTEPSISGLHDLERLVRVCRRFDLKIFVAINRFDLEEQTCREIEAYCDGEGLAVVGKIPFDPEVIEAVRNNQPVTRVQSPAADVILAMHKTLSRHLEMP